MAEQRDGGREGISFQTLVLAAVSSGLAAIIVSQFWENGTAIAAAMTPVIVSLVKEALQRPMESEVVKRPVQRIASGSRSAVTRTTSRTERVRSPRPATAEHPPPPRSGYPATNGGATNGASANGASAHDDEPPLTPMRTYGKPRRRPLHLKLAIVTGLLAFVIAAVALTVPELIFGGSVSSSGNKTTLFGGSKSGSDSDKDKQKDSDKPGSESDSESRQQDGSDQAEPAAPESESEPPAAEEPAPSEEEPEPAPSEPEPAPAPSSPVPSAPAPPTP